MASLLNNILYFAFQFILVEKFNFIFNFEKKNWWRMSKEKNNSTCIIRFEFCKSLQIRRFTLGHTFCPPFFVTLFRAVFFSLSLSIYLFPLSFLSLVWIIGNLCIISQRYLFLYFLFLSLFFSFFLSFYISPSQSLSLSLLSLPPSLVSISFLLSLFSLSFSLAYLMDVFVLVILYLYYYQLVTYLHSRLTSAPTSSRNISSCAI